MKSIHGPKIEVQDYSSEGALRDGSRKSRLRCPHLCQEDNEGNALIADADNDRLLVFTADCKWHDVTPDVGLDGPTYASWSNGRLYVSSSFNRSITMCE